MFSKPAERQVRCYHCGRGIIVPVQARSASCPVCYKGLVLDDLRVKGTGTPGKLTTCGRIVIERKGRAVARHVEAGTGVEVQGELRANVSSGGTVVLAEGARFAGEVCAPSLVVEPGAVIQNAMVRIGPGQGLFAAGAGANRPAT